MYCYHCMNEIREGDFCTYCMRENQDKNEPHQLKAGTMLNGKYIVGNVLGEGGFGITYIGLDTTLDLCVAIKEYFPNGRANRNHETENRVVVTNSKNLDFFKNGKEKFLVETKNIARFSKEKGVVDVRDYFEENDTAYIIMEYLEGQTLGEFVRHNSDMDATEEYQLYYNGNMEVIRAYGH